MAELRQLVETYDGVLGKEYQGDPGDIVTIAIAAIIHSFYNGVEGIFTRIAKRIDESMPRGEDSHARLLERMTHATSRRPAVLSESLARNLKSYMDFRHLFRHAYANYLAWDRMEPLARECKQTFHKFETEVMHFLREIETTDQ